MASFRIHTDAENHPNVMRLRNKENGNGQLRPVLGIVSNNTQISKNTKNHAQVSKRTLQDGAGWRISVSSHFLDPA